MNSPGILHHIPHIEQQNGLQAFPNLIILIDPFPLPFFRSAFTKFGTSSRLFWEKEACFCLGCGQKVRGGGSHVRTN
jgi:hypothetical protein